MKTACEIKELQRQETGAYERTKVITELIEKQVKERPAVSVYIHPAVLIPDVCEILTEMGYNVTVKKDEITRQMVTEITWK